MNFKDFHTRFINEQEEDEEDFGLVDQETSEPSDADDNVGDLPADSSSVDEIPILIPTDAQTKLTYLDVMNNDELYIVIWKRAIKSSAFNVFMVGYIEQSVEEKKTFVRVLLSSYTSTMNHLSSSFVLSFDLPYESKDEGISFLNDIVSTIENS